MDLTWYRHALVHRMIQLRRRAMRQPEPDTKDTLFAELRARLGETRPARILEVGPKHGNDTRRLATLRPDTLVLVDLPNQEEHVRSWLPEIEGCAVELHISNLMYERALYDMEPFDVVWCTGVLYHNPEQLRMIARLYDLTRPGGLLVLESSTARRPGTRDAVCVEIWRAEDDAPEMKKRHISKNVTHLPSEGAIRVWLKMAGFEGIERSRSGALVSPKMDRDRVAFIARRPETDAREVYYTVAGQSYRVGDAL